MALIHRGHEIPTSHAADGIEFLAEDTQELIGKIGRTPDGLDTAFKASSTLSRTRGGLDPEAEEFDTWASYVTSMQLGSAPFAAAATDEPAIEYRVDRQLRSIPTAGAQSYAHTGSSISALWLATICREQNRVTELCNVHFSTLRAFGATFDEDIYSCPGARLGGRVRDVTAGSTQQPMGQPS
ncbi:Imm49 family immunity protein [Streptomyces sp. Tue6028]|uniref:Imm49 family immunity protein n=1 Tax=Streptomyces sp. Tue6028 TaxID=2036037 RepID=UPI000BB3B78D|nr:Imm49 family immunity protein [Streptomyces sp. Tue6028]